MFKSLLFVILLSFPLQKACCQSIDSIDWEENNRALKRGLEWKAELKVKNQKIDSLNAVIDSLKANAGYRDTLETLLYICINKKDEKIDYKNEQLCEMENQLNIVKSEYAQFKRKKRITDYVLSALSVLVTIF